jgi:hypothetical protein
VKPSQSLALAHKIAPRFLLRVVDVVSAETEEVRELVSVVISDSFLDLLFSVPSRRRNMRFGEITCADKLNTLLTRHNEFGVSGSFRCQTSTAELGRKGPLSCQSPECVSGFHDLSPSAVFW